MSFKKNAVPFSKVFCHKCAYKSTSSMLEIVIVLLKIPIDTFQKKIAHLVETVMHFMIQSVLTKLFKLQLVSLIAATLILPSHI